jgi:hypothetical protein
VNSQKQVEAKIARDSADRRAAVIARRKQGTTHARITREQEFYRVEVCNTLVGDHWYTARLFRSQRAARMWCKREHLNVIAED